MHHDHAKTLLEAGKHVLCEKPLDLSPGGCRLLFSAAAAADRLLTVGYNMRQDPVLKSLRERVLDGEFGAPSLMRINRFHAYPDEPSEWRKSKETSGGWSINDIGTHCIDQCIWFLGRAVDVSGHLTTRRFDVETDDLSVVGMKFENGAVGSIEASTALPAGPPRVEFYGTKGWFMVELSRMASVIRLKEQIGEEPAKEKPVEEGDRDLFKLEAEAFGRAIRGEEEAAVQRDDAVHNIEIIEQARGYKL
jgi:predicted dehydrogenase